MLIDLIVAIIHMLHHHIVYPKYIQFLSVNYIWIELGKNKAQNPYKLKNKSAILMHFAKINSTLTTRLVGKKKYKIKYWLTNFLWIWYTNFKNISICFFFNLEKIFIKDSNLYNCKTNNCNFCHLSFIRVTVTSNNLKSHSALHFWKTIKSFNISLSLEQLPLREKKSFHISYVKKTHIQRRGKESRIIWRSNRKSLSS